MSQAEVVVVTCVIDSSLALAAEWPHILADYIVPLLHRLGEHQPRISFVGYGTADTRPTPILHKVFFNPPPQLLLKMREHPQELGIGQTGSGGGYGMAALEGLVAALEMYDTLKASVDSKPQQVEPNVTCYLIHVASTPPDPAERPLWNMSPALDSVTWDTLSSEIRKRGIHYSNILLKQIPRFTELHTSAAAGNVQAPWFTVRTPHIVHLTGFPQQQKGTKRPSLSTSASVGGSPELKRPKVQTASPRKSPAVPPATTPAMMIKSPPPPAPKAASPKIPAPAPPAPPAAPAPAAPQTSSRPPDNSSIVTPEMLLDPAKRQEIQNKLRQAEQAMRTQMAQVMQFEKEGKAEIARHLRAAVQQRAEKLRVFKAQLVAQVQQVQAQVAANAAGAQAAPAPAPAPAAAKQPTATQLSAAPGRPAPHAPQHATPVMQNSVPKPPMSGQVNPELAAQMQKLLEQKSKIAPSHPQPSTSTSPEKAPAQVPRSQWLGTLSWRGFDSETHLRKDVHTRVTMITRPDAAPLLRLETWPNHLHLAPSQHPAVPEKALHAWIQQHKWIPLSVQCASSSPDLDAKTNEEHYRSLIRLLTEKNVYALAAWKNMAGVMENRLLLFITNQNRLVAGYFPQPGGVPELPKGDGPVPAPAPAPAPAPGPGTGAVPGPSQGAPNPLAGMAPQMIALLQQQMSPEQQAVFAKMNPEQKTAVLRSIAARLALVKQRQQQAQQQQQQQQQQAHQQQLQAQMSNLVQQQQQQQQREQQWLGANQGANMNMNMAALFGQLGQQGQGQGQGQAGPSNMNANQMMAAMGMGMGMGSVGPNMGMNFGMGAVGQQGQQGQQGMMPGMHRRTPSAGNPNNTMLSPEMLQSFMQRSQDGSGGSNGALGGMA